MLCSVQMSKRVLREHAATVARRTTSQRSVTSLATPTTSPAAIARSKDTSLVNAPSLRTGPRCSVRTANNSVTPSRLAGQNSIEAIILTSHSAARLLLPKKTPWVEAVLSKLPVAGARAMMLLLPPILEAKLPGTLVAMVVVAGGKAPRNAPYQLHSANLLF